MTENARATRSRRFRQAGSRAVLAVRAISFSCSSALSSVPVLRASSSLLPLSFG